MGTPSPSVHAVWSALASVQAALALLDGALLRETPASDQDERDWLRAYG